MKSSSRNAFTLIEMLTVMLIIAVITGLLVQVSGYVHKKSAMERARGEIATISAACEQYKADNGSYPRDAVTDKLDPKDSKDGMDPTKSTYKDASLYLYKCLSGDLDANNKPDADEKQYMEIKASMKGMKSSSNGATSTVAFLMDPFGNSYGYSTARAKAEEDYQAKLQKNRSEPRPDKPPGFNPTFDMWSTAGYTMATSQAATDPSKSETDRNRWVKNW